MAGIQHQRQCKNVMPESEGRHPQSPQEGEAACCFCPLKSGSTEQVGSADVDAVLVQVAGLSVCWREAWMAQERVGVRAGKLQAPQYTSQTSSTLRHQPQILCWFISRYKFIKTDL